jgi:hypothetical protein
MAQSIVGGVRLPATGNHGCCHRWQSQPWASSIVLLLGTIASGRNDSACAAVVREPTPKLAIRCR